MPLSPTAFHDPSSDVLAHDLTAVQQGPIGVFDSGVGGLSILQALRTELPHEDFVYFADSGHAPYGEREDSVVVARSLAIAHHLLGKRGGKRARWSRFPVPRRSVRRSWKAVASRRSSNCATCDGNPVGSTVC